MCAQAYSKRPGTNTAGLYKWACCNQDGRLSHMIGLWTRWAAFINSGVMAYAYRNIFMK